MLILNIIIMMMLKKKIYVPNNVQVNIQFQIKMMNKNVVTSVNIILLMI